MIELLSYRKYKSTKGKSSDRSTSRFTIKTAVGKNEFDEDKDKKVGAGRRM